MCGERSSVSVLHLRLLFSVGTGDASREVTECFRGLRGCSAILSSVSRIPVKVSGCMHCTDVLCQLLVASVDDTNACGCKISMLSTDTMLRAFSSICGKMP